MQSKPSLVRSQPQAYLIDKNHIVLIDKLKVLGIEVKTISEDQIHKVEVFTISKFNNDGFLYEKMKIQDVEATLSMKEINFPAGTFMIQTNQKNAALLAEILEPEAPNSFVHFGVLTTELNQELPIYRLPKTF